MSRVTDAVVNHNLTEFTIEEVADLVTGADDLLDAASARVARAFGHGGQLDDVSLTQALVMLRAAALWWDVVNKEHAARLHRGES